MKKAAIIILIIISVLFLSVYAWLRSQVPDYNQSIKAPGLTDTVTVTRNEYAVPTITAKNDDDLYFAWGYVNAQDRMFQLEVTRRIGQGRISEFGGPDTLDKDIFLRAVGFYRIAQRAVTQLDPQTTRAMQRYVDGINYYLETEGPNLYMKLLGLEKEKWTMADPMMVGMMLNWSLGYNMKHELLYYKMAKKIGLERARQLFNYVPADTSTIFKDETMKLADAMSLDVLNRLGELAGCLSASNNWAISRKKTADGSTILSTDMQVHSSKLPSDFYYVRVISGDLDATGAQVVGLPFIASGYNRNVAWGLTNQGADMVDLFIEQVDRENGTYLRNGTLHRLTVREETFKVKGEEPVTRKIYYAGRRPLMNDVFTDIKADISLDWTGFDSVSVSGFFNIKRARSYREVISGAAKVKMSPQNMVFADRNGTIGYRVIGSLPMRKDGTGNIPSDGTKVSANWNGFIPDARYPMLLNPSRGYLITANNKVMPDYRYYLNATYAPGYRYENIAAMLRNHDAVDVEYVKKMQTDTHTVLAKKVIPMMMKYVQAEGEKAVSALQLLQEWDTNVTKKSVAASIYNTFLVRFMYHTLVDEIGKEMTETYIGERYISMERFFKLIEDNSIFFDDINTDAHESISDIATRAFEDTFSILENYTGSSDIDDWQWGKVHFIKFDHFLGKSAMLKPLVNYGPFPFEGDSETNKRARFYEVEPPFIANSASAPRIVVHFGKETRGHMMLITGQNEYFMSPHNTDMIDAWLDEKFFCMEEAEQVYSMEIRPL
ncbi:MAG TPA: penicillin acylase family protein [Spirochaetota bacterium]|nr:penicillin acylase family protein [Spirochaetota bacterium]